MRVCVPLCWRGTQAVTHMRTSEDKWWSRSLSSLKGRASGTALGAALEPLPAESSHRPGKSPLTHLGYIRIFFFLKIDFIYLCN